MVLLYQYAFHILAFFLEDSRREDEKHFDIQGEGVIKKEIYRTGCWNPIRRKMYASPAPESAFAQGTRK
jgi:hypothetical protein